MSDAQRNAAKLRTSAGKGADLDASKSVKAAPHCSLSPTFLRLGKNRHSPLAAQQCDGCVGVSTGAG
jgi:hypothetical protein